MGKEGALRLALGLSLAAALLACFAHAGPAWAGTLQDWEENEYKVIGRMALTDALGKPLPGETVVTTGDKRVPVDAGGSVDMLELGKAFDGYMEVSHPAYGRVRVKNLRDVAHARLALPVVRTGTPEEGRSVRGVVKDSEGKPVKDAWVRVSDGIRELWTMTDEAGAFRTHPAVDLRQVKDAGGWMLPADETVMVTIKSDDPWYAPFREFAGGSERVFTLHRAKRQYKVTIKDAPSEPGVTYYKYVSWHSVKLGIRVAMWDGINWDDARVPLMEGRYTLWVGGKRYRPVEVKETGPEELVFEPEADVVCSGSVVDAQTGKPVAGVLVGIRQYGNDQNITEIPSEAWERIKGLKNPVDTLRDVPKAFIEMLNLKGCAVTDGAGAFSLNLTGGETVSLITLAPGYVPSLRHVDNGRGGMCTESGKMRTRPIEMVRGAVAVLEPALSSKERMAGEGKNPRMHLVAHTPAKWTAQYRNEDPYTRMLMIPYTVGLGKQEVMVPAGVPVTFMLTRFEEGDPEWSVPNSASRWVSAEGEVVLKPGEKKRVEMARQEMVKVKVRLLLSDGLPLEGYPVALRVAKRPEVWSSSGLTDKDGNTVLYCPAGKWVKIGLGEVSIDRGAVTVDYQTPVGVREAVLPIRISDEQVRAVVPRDRYEALIKSRQGRMKIQEENGE